MNIITLIQGNIKRKKKQSILMVVIILAATTMLFSALGLLQNIDGVVDEVLEEHTTSHYILRFNETAHSPDKLEDFWKSHEAVESVYRVESIIRNGNIIHEGRSISTPEIVIGNANQHSNSQDMLNIIEGDPKSLPGNNEVWITTAFAYSENVEVGDILQLSVIGASNNQYEVTAIVFDPLYSNEFMPPRFWLCTETFGLLTGQDNSKEYIMGIRFKDYEKAPVVWDEFQEFLNDRYIGNLLTYDSVKMGYSMLYNIMSGSILGFSVILTFIAVFVVFTVLKRSIASETSTIGILKAQGFSSAQIKWAYMVQYIIIQLCAMPLALLLGSFILSSAGDIVLKNIGRNGLSIRWLSSYIITLIIITLATVLSTMASTLKIRRIKPSQAIRYNGYIYTNKRSTAVKSRMVSNLPISVFLGIKQIFLKKGQSIFIALIAAFTSFTIFYGVSGLASLMNSFDNMAFWGADNREITIMTPYYEHQKVDEIEESVRKIDMVDRYSFYCEVPVAIDKTNEHKTKNVIAMVYNDFDAVDIINLKGRNPEYENEVSISTVLAEDYSKKIGDIIETYINGEKNIFIVTGIYQTVLHMGNNIRLHRKAIENKEISNPTSFLVVLNDGVTPNAFIEFFDKEYGHYNVIIEQKSEIQGIFVTMSVLMEPIMLAVSLIFIFIMLLILTNYVFINVLEFKKDFGIYKSLGMTNTQVRLITISNFSTLTFIGSIVSVGLGILVVPKILLLTMGAFGFESFPFILPLAEILLITPVITLFVMACTWVAGKGIVNISPRELIIE